MKRGVLFGGIFLLCGCLALWACDSKGPADPFTGLITYPVNPKEAGKQGSSVPANAPGPFAGGKFYKAWQGNDMKFIVVPVGSTLSFEGVIISATPVTPPRPPDWEEGEATNQYATTITAAPKPAWTITGNGGGDFAPGDAPPSTGPGGFSFKSFEQPAGAMIVPDSPQTKATWTLKYDQALAWNLLKTGILSNPEGVTLLNKSMTDQGIKLDFNAVAQNGPGTPQVTKGADAFNGEDDNSTISAEKGGIDPRKDEPAAMAYLKSELAAKLCHNVGDADTDGSAERSYKDSDGTVYQMPIPAEGRVIVKSGYVAMQQWYPTGQYSPKFFISPPSCDPIRELQKDQTTWTFDTPTAPDYWTFDLHAGLESKFDAVWCWVEGTVKAKPENTVIPKGSAMKEYFDFTADVTDTAVGGVLVSGTYITGKSTQSRNTKTFVVVVDTAAPASFTWSAEGWTTPNLVGETGKLLQDCSANPGTVKFRVFDNNPLIGCPSGFNKIKDALDRDGKGMDFAALTLVEAGAKAGGENQRAAFEQYLFDNQDGFAGALQASLTYNVCVPGYVALRGKAPDNGFTPFPLVENRLVVPIQRFVWKTIPVDPAWIPEGSRAMYNADHARVTGLADLVSDKAAPAAEDSAEDAADAGAGKTWWGYSSFDVEVPISALDEPMGANFAVPSQEALLPFRDPALGDLQPPATVPEEASGTPIVFDKGIFFYPWAETALKIFPAATDGSGNMTPSAEDFERLCGLRFSGVALPQGNDKVAFWKETEGNLGQAAEVTPVRGGGLAVGKTPGDWGNFLFVKEVKDVGKPNIALQVLNSKNNQSVMYGNLAAGSGQSKSYWEAFAAATERSVVVACDTNRGETAYTAQDSEFNDAEGDSHWEFNQDLQADLYLELQTAVEENTFRPWFAPVPATMPMDPVIQEKYWNAGKTWNDKRLAYHQDSRIPLVFQYWTWDNINPYKFDHTCPGGIQTGTEDSCKPDAGERKTATITLRDDPSFPGQPVAADRFWRDYNFMNPNDGGEECSLTLEARDESANRRRLKVWFRILSPSVEAIRTLEDNRQRLGH